MEDGRSSALEARLLAIDEKLQKLLSYHENGNKLAPRQLAPLHERASATPTIAWSEGTGDVYGADKGVQGRQLRRTGEGDPHVPSGQLSCSVFDGEDGCPGEPASPLNEGAIDGHRGVTPRKSMQRELTKLEELNKTITVSRRSVKNTNKSTFAQTVDSFVNRREFEWTIAAIIGLNGLFLGVQIDWQVKHPTSERLPPIFRMWEVLCCVIFTIELGLRFFASGLALFKHENRDRTWYMFDTFLVSFSLLDEFMVVFSIATLNAAMVRLLRVFRLVRVLRLIRVVRMLHDLRIIVVGITSSLNSLFWATSLIFLLMYIYAIVLLQLILEQITTGHDQELKNNLLVYYDSLLSTIYTLSLSISGGLNWGEACEPLGEISGAVLITYVAFIAFSILCMFNVVTGCLVDKALKTTALDEERMMMEDIEERKRWLKDIKRLFEEADLDENGYLDKDEFLRIVSDVRMQYYFRKIGLDVQVDNVNGIFEFLDVDGDGTVDVHEFATAIEYLHGPARSVDLARIRHSLRKLQTRVDENLPQSPNAEVPINAGALLR